MLGPIHPIFRAVRVEALRSFGASPAETTDKRGPVATQEAPATHPVRAGNRGSSLSTTARASARAGF